jgi:hypothetical protein
MRQLLAAESRIQTRKNCVKGEKGYYFRILMASKEIEFPYGEPALVAKAAYLCPAFYFKVVRDVPLDGRDGRQGKVCAAARGQGASSGTSGLPETFLIALTHADVPVDVALESGSLVQVGPS